LFPNTVQRAGRKVIPGFAGKSDQARFDPVLILSVTPPGLHKIPAVLLDQAKDVADFHTGTITAEGTGVNAHPACAGGKEKRPAIAGRFSS